MSETKVVRLFLDLLLNISLLGHILFYQGVGNTLKRHYETYLLEYELAHDDVDGECCLLCHRLYPYNTHKLVIFNT